MVLLKKVQKLQFISVFLGSCILLLPFFFFACDKNNKQDDPLAGKSQVTEEKLITDYIQHSYNGNELKIIKGNFRANESENSAVLFEVNKGPELGIRFILLHVAGDSVSQQFSSSLFDGAVNEAVYEKIRVPGKNYDGVYYNSGSYFMGSGGGEIFSYIVDFSEAKIYTAHLFILKNQVPKLFIPEIVRNTEMGTFFQKKCKIDFPNVQVVSRDYKFVD